MGKKDKPRLQFGEGMLGFQLRFEGERCWRQQWWRRCSVEGAAAPWWRGRRRGGEGSGLEARGFQHEREAFVFCIFNFIYLTNLTVKLLF